MARRQRHYRRHALWRVWDTAREGDQRWEGICRCDWTATARTQREVRAAYSRHISPYGDTQGALAVGTRLNWEVGQTVYARWRMGDDWKDPLAYWYEPWWVTLVGRTRIHVRGYGDGEEGTCSRYQLETTGYATCYGPWDKLVAGIHMPWSEQYVRYQLARDRADAIKAGGHWSPNTLGGRWRLEKRHEALAALGLPYSADDAAAKAVYRSLAMRHHPDKGGDHETFLRIQRAWEVISDPQDPKLWELIEAMKRHVEEEMAKREGEPTP